MKKSGHAYYVTTIQCFSIKLYLTYSALSASSASTALASVSGFISGNNNTSRIEAESVKNITRRSIPIPRLADGSLGKATSVAHIKGLSDDTVSLAHQCVLDKTGQWLLVPTQGRHIGHERIYVFKVNAETGELTEQSHIDARTYAEPRHLTISKDNRHVYVVNEKGNSVTYYDFDDAKGILTALQIIPSLPETYTGQGQASAVLLSPSEEFLYETNRIHESVAIYRVNKETGFLTNLGFTSVLGKTPRFFTFMPDGKQLLIANEDSDTLQLFDVDEEHGHLTFTGITVATASPTCVVFK